VFRGNGRERMYVQRAAIWLVRGLETMSNMELGKKQRLICSEKKHLCVGGFEL
jgi:hypothetical protein